MGSEMCIRDRVFVNASGSGAPGPPGEEVTKYHYTIEVGNNANVNIQVNKGDVNVVTKEGNINLKGGRDINLDAAQAIRLRPNKLEAEIDNTWTEKVSGNNTKTGKKIDLN